MGGNYTSGNTETQALNLSGSYTHRQARHRLQVDGKYNRGWAKGELVAQNAAGSLRYDYYLNRQLYVLGNQLFEYDLFQNLAIRSTTMAGLGYDLFDHKSHLLTFGAGPAVVYQNFTTEPSTVSPSAMWLVRWYREFRGGDLRLFHHHQGFQDVGASRAFRLNADQGIRVKIFGDFSLNLEYDLRFNTEPAPGRKELDQAFIFGVAYESNASPVEATQSTDSITAMTHGLLGRWSQGKDLNLRPLGYEMVNGVCNERPELSSGFSL